MSQFSLSRFNGPLMIAPAIVITVGIITPVANAQDTVYTPIPLPPGNEVTDVLSDRDIPTGMGGFARDYVASFEAGDHIVIDLASDEFDTIITLIGPDGATIGENDDGPDGTTNSMLFMRIAESGNYILRVRSFAGQGTGEFNLKVTRLRPVD
jgi:hypothetical protein